MKIIVLSPHLDDAGLDCTDHITRWKKNGNNVLIVTVFTKLTAQKIPLDTKLYVQNSGFSTTQAFQKGRLLEDAAAMKKLNCKYEYLNLVDAGFRNKGSGPIFKTFKELFSGKYMHVESKLINQLAQKLKQYHQKNTLYYLPFGVGKHADHLILRKAAETVFPPSQLRYYLDFPYALSIGSWLKLSKKDLLYIIKASKSAVWTSPFKREVLKSYSSQMPLLFKSVNYPSFPEIILSQKL